MRLSCVSVSCQLRSNRSNQHRVRNRFVSLALISLFETAHVQLVATVANYVISPLLRMAIFDAFFPSSQLPMRFHLHPRTSLHPAFSKSLNGESNMNQFCHSRHLPWLRSFPFHPFCPLRHEPRCSTPTYPDKFHPTIE